MLQHDPKWVRKWQRRFQATPPVQVNTFFSQARATHKPPNRVSAAVKKWIVQLRQELSERYHRPAGPKTLQAGYQHLLKTASVPFALPRSSSTLTQILREAGCIRSRQPLGTNRWSFHRQWTNGN
jgi:hypothetical protein